jgi:hypothetical protein
MRNELIKSALLVFAMWFVVLLVWAMPDTAVLRATAIELVLIWLGGTMLGLGVSFIRRGFRHSTIAQETHAEAGDGPAAFAAIMTDPKTMATEPVPLPAPLMPDLAGRIRAAINSKGREHGRVVMREYVWWSKFEREHPLHAAALLDMWSIILSKHRLPAAPVPQDHGGATLAEHSLHVLDAMLELAKTWRYDGVKDTKGEVVVPVADVNKGFHKFAPGDPILVLAAIAHDIGKVECYKQIDPKHPERVVEVLPNHGELGAKMLRAVPSLMALPIQERQAVLLAVSYYHHASDMPIAGWIGDMPRSLTLLLYDADCLASRREGGGDAVAMVNAPPPEHSDTQAEPAMEAGPDMSEAEPEPDAPAPATPAAAPAQPRTAVSKPAASTPQPRVDDDRPYWQHESARTPLDFLQSALARSGAVNGKNRAARLAIWFSPWAYVLDQKLRNQVKEEIGEVAGLAGERGQMAAFTKELLAQLEDKGWLYCVHDGQRYSHKSALWYVDVEEQEPSVMLIACEDVIAPVVRANAPKFKRAPVVERCLWGATRALDKNVSAQPTELPPAAPEVADQVNRAPNAEPPPFAAALPPGLMPNTQDEPADDDGLMPNPPLTLDELRAAARAGKYMPVVKDDGTVYLDRTLALQDFSELPDMPDGLPEGVVLVKRKDGTVYLKFDME